MDKKRYCFSCGSEVKVIPFICYYETETGEPVFYESRECPNKRWYHHFLGHPVTEGESYADQAG